MVGWFGGDPATAAPLTDTVVLRPSYARVEDLERILGRVLPGVSVAGVVSQGTLIVSGTPEELRRVGALMRELDVKGAVVELGVRLTGSGHSSGSTIGVGVRVRKAGAPPSDGSPDTTLSSTNGRSRQDAEQVVVATAGRPVEVFVGEDLLISGGPLTPPSTISAGFLVKIDGLRVVDNGQGAEMDVTLEATRPGAPPVVRQGTRAATSIRLRQGQTQQVVAQTDDSDAAASDAAAAAADQSGSTRRRRTTARTASSTSVAITLRGIR